MCLGSLLGMVGAWPFRVDGGLSWFDRGFLDGIEGSWMNSAASLLFICLML